MTGRLSGSSQSITAMTERNPALGRMFMQSRAAAILLDFVLVALGVLVAYIARFEGLIPASFFRQLMVAAPLAAILSPRWALTAPRAWATTSAKAQARQSRAAKTAAGMQGPFAACGRGAEYAGGPRIRAPGRLSERAF